MKHFNNTGTSCLWTAASRGGAPESRAAPCSSPQPLPGHGAVSGQERDGLPLLGASEWVLRVAIGKEASFVALRGILLVEPRMSVRLVSWDADGKYSLLLERLGTLIELQEGLRHGAIRQTPGITRGLPLIHDAVVPRGWCPVFQPLASRQDMGGRDLWIVR